MAPAPARSTGSSARSRAYDRARRLSYGAHARHDSAWHGAARLGGAWQGTARRGVARQDKARNGAARDFGPGPSSSSGPARGAEAAHCVSVTGAAVSPYDDPAERKHAALRPVPFLVTTINCRLDPRLADGDPVGPGSQNNGLTAALTVSEPLGRLAIDRDGEGCLTGLRPDTQAVCCGVQRYRCVRERDRVIASASAAHE